MRIKRIIGYWLPLALISTAVCFLVFISIQQTNRQDANDPQVQLTQDAAAALSNGETFGSLFPGKRVDIKISLAPFVIVYDSAGKPIAGSGLLSGALPEIPFGVLENAKLNGENRVTWQPETDVRIASVVVPIKTPGSGFVVAGRSLREVETRVNEIQLFAGLTLIGLLLGTLLIVIFSEFFLIRPGKS
jgi:hypothetical protein